MKAEELKEGQVYEGFDGRYIFIHEITHTIENEPRPYQVVTSGWVKYAGDSRTTITRDVCSAKFLADMLKSPQTKNSQKDYSKWVKLRGSNFYIVGEKSTMVCDKKNSAISLVNNNIIRVVEDEKPLLYDIVPLEELKKGDVVCFYHDEEISILRSESFGVYLGRGTFRQYYFHYLVELDEYSMLDIHGIGIGYSDEKVVRFRR